MRILYLNHTAQMSGGEHSLIALLRALPEHVHAAVACPEGALADAVAALGVAVHRVPGTDVSLRLGLVQTPRGLLEMVRCAWAVRRVAAATGAEVVHANSIRAGIVAVLAARLGAPPALVHLHDALPEGRVPGLTLELLSRGALGALSNSRYTDATLERPRRRLPSRVVLNPVDLARHAASPSRREARDRLGLASEDRVLAMVAQITPWKGQDDAVRVLEGLRRSEPRACLLLVGSAKFVAESTRYDNRRYLEEVHALVKRLGLEDKVRFLGERDDVPSILPAADLVLVPSWQEPFGRVVIEAMAAGVPVLATNVGGPPEIIREGEGRLLPPRDPGRWAREAASLLSDEAARSAIADRGRARARDFSAGGHAERVLAAYEELL